MTNKIPFDLDLWKTDKYDVVTRDGHKAKILYVHDNLTTQYPIVYTYCDDKNEDDFLICVSINGEEYIKESNKCDIFLIPKKKKLFIAVDKKSLTGSEQGTEKGCKFHVTTNAYESIRDLPPLTHRQIIEIEIEDSQ